MDTNQAKQTGYRTRYSVGHAASVLFSAVPFGLVIVLGCDTRRPSVAAAKPAGEVQPLFTPQTATLAQQKMCEEQAGKKFKEERYSDFDKKDSLPLTSYTSHYDPTVNVRYVRINSFGGVEPGTVTHFVIDAFGGREYAAYIWVNPLKEERSAVSPSECDIDIPGKPQQKCTTDTEFDELTEKYFGVPK